MPKGAGKWTEAGVETEGVTWPCSSSSSSIVLEHLWYCFVDGNVCFNMIIKKYFKDALLIVLTSLDSFATSSLRSFTFGPTTFNSCLTSSIFHWMSWFWLFYKRKTILFQIEHFTWSNIIWVVIFAPERKCEYIIPSIIHAICN